ncbi:MAG: hypothetical protein JRI89_10560 [Deltaproteobacteria bacterium]|nr:hypothetical protein [Deltaproteobacteria bacterium]
MVIAKSSKNTSGFRLLVMVIFLAQGAGRRAQGTGQAAAPPYQVIYLALFFWRRAQGAGRRAGGCAALSSYFFGAGRRAQGTGQAAAPPYQVIYLARGV